MAGKKINELTERTTLQGTENIPFQDGSSNGRFSSANLKEFAKQDLSEYQKAADADKKYVAKEKGKRLMTDEEGTKLSKLENYDDTGIREEIDVLEEKMDSIYPIRMDYCVGAWNPDDLSPKSIETHGNKSFLEQWDFFLADTTQNEGATTKPVGKLMRNNLLRFSDGRFAPTVGITEAMRAECDVELYLDAAHTQKVCDAGAFDAESFYNEHGIHSLYDASGNEVRQLLPWETTETKYTIGLGREDTVYLLDNVIGNSGKQWCGVFRQPVIFDGIDVSKYPLAPTAISPSPVCTVGNKTRCFFYLYEGENNCKSSSGEGGICTLFSNGRTYPRTNDMHQINDMNWSRANNADPESPVPFAEGGYHALNTYITCNEVLHGTKYLHDSGLFGSGISSNDSYSTEELWKKNGGVRYRKTGESEWKYAAFSSQTDIYNNASGNRTTMSIFLNKEHPKEQVMESQMAASFAMETGIAQNTEFEFYGGTYRWVSATETDGSGRMNIRVYKVMSQTVSAYLSDGTPQQFDIEVCLRFSLLGGFNFSGDVFAYWGGGYEQVGTKDTSSLTGNPISIYLEPDQKTWMRETLVSKSNLGIFDFEEAYNKLTETVNLGDGYAKNRSPYSGWKTEEGGNISSGQCFRTWDNGHWGLTLNTRYRIAARFRGSASAGTCSGRYLSADYAVTSANRYIAGSAQFLLQVGAAPLQAE